MHADIPADFPVAALWPDGEGGLTGYRALQRLQDAGITTIGELLDTDAEDILLIPRAGEGVLTEVRRALTARGLALKGDPSPFPEAIREALRIGRERAARHQERGQAPEQAEEENLTVTREDFTSLVAAVRAIREHTPAGDSDRLRARLNVLRRAHPWAASRVGPETASAVTGYSPTTIRAYTARAKHDHDYDTVTSRTMPLPENGTWNLWDLAVWVAGRNDRQAAGYQAGPAKQREARRLDDEEVSEFLLRELTSTRRYLTQAKLRDALRKAGYPAPAEQIRRLLPALRTAAAKGHAAQHRTRDRDRGESLHPRGWLSAVEVAEDWGITPAAVSRAIRRGDIKVAERANGRTWIDPARLRSRTDALATPVDLTHPKAGTDPPA